MRLAQYTFIGIAALTVLVTAAPAQTSDSPKKPRELSSKTNEPLNRVSISYRAGFNVDIRFKNVGAFRPFNPGNLMPNSNHEYEDGYVRDDSNDHPNPDEWTWNHNYRHADQLSGQLLSMHSSAADGATGKTDGDIRNGFEITYSRELGQIEKCKWGFELAFNYMGTGADDSRPYASTTSRITDVYKFPDEVVPLPPSPAPTGNDGPGTTNGPGPVIISTPVSRTNTLNSGTSSTTGSRSFDADIFGFRLGPYLKIPLCKRASVLLSGGLALAQVNSDFKYSEMVTISTPTLNGTFPTSASGSHSELLAGGYFAANLTAKLSERFDAFAGVQFQSVGTYRHKLKDETAEMDLSKSIFFVVGLGLSF